MPRTTLNLDASVLRELRHRQRRQGTSLGQLASELLARALASDQTSAQQPPFTWYAQPMGARVDLDDRDALETALEADPAS